MQMGVFSSSGSYLCSTFCGPIMCTYINIIVIIIINMDGYELET